MNPPLCKCHGESMLVERRNGKYGGQQVKKDSWRCRVVHRETFYRKRRAQRARADQIKIERGCIDCGYSTSPVALAFDHIDPETKAASVSQLLNGASMARVLAEIDKCEVRCHNCHAIKTQGQARAKAQRQNEPAAVAAL